MCIGRIELFDSLRLWEATVLTFIHDHFIFALKSNDNDIQEYTSRADEEDSTSEVDVMKCAYFSKVNTEKLITQSTINPVSILFDSGCDDSTTEIECSICSESLHEDNNDDAASDDSQEKAGSTRRRVNFALQLIAEKYEIPSWSPEEKASLFYTGKELHQFRVEHMIELYESQEASRMDEWSKFEGRRSLRIFWSFYSVFIDFLTCKALTQYCCGGQRNVSDETM